MRNCGGFGLREARVPDARRTLPGCTSAHGLLQARNLTHAHKGRKPLYEGVNFDLPGGVTALLGTTERAKPHWPGFLPASISSRAVKSCLRPTVRCKTTHAP